MNSIRTPKQGKSRRSRLIALAVDDQAWQEFRVSLLGQSTATKLERLFKYWVEDTEALKNVVLFEGEYECLHVVRIMNYVSALIRGGLIEKDDIDDDLNHASTSYPFSGQWYKVRRG